MDEISVTPLREDLCFGARISGATRESLADGAVRTRLNEALEDRGLILFEDVEPTSAMQVAISEVFGPLKQHPVPSVDRVDDETLPGVIEIRANPDEHAVVEIDGKPLVTWQPWHFDHSYNNELNRAGVLRSLTLPPEGGETGFADGIQLYRALTPELREQIEGCNILYDLDLLYGHLRFGRPPNFRLRRDNPVMEELADMPRAVHPAVWTRRTGEKVLHLSGWGASGIEGRENPEGDALFEAVCQEVLDKVQPYFHRWSPTDMIVWDNWRMLHAGAGCDPAHARLMHRTTIRGDYGLGYWEGEGPQGETTAACSA